MHRDQQFQGNYVCLYVYMWIFTILLFITEKLEIVSSNKELLNYGSSIKEYLEPLKRGKNY